ncbi:hypothetical protein BVRB_3g069310 [Beta vulgaris subsp. vulgaris]|nr:hypothetical protein BVRB_3g069310 [Beta vulgaris subsp. vulgaris]
MPPQPSLFFFLRSPPPFPSCQAANTATHLLPGCHHHHPLPTRLMRPVLSEEVPLKKLSTREANKPRAYRGGSYGKFLDSRGQVRLMLF